MTGDADMPVELMLATLTDRRDFGEDWLLERKLDGERCVARKDGGDVRLQSRTAKNLSATYPEVRAAVAAQRPGGLLLDGELVAFDGGQTSFSRLQQRLGVAEPSPQLVAEYPVVYCVFDLLAVDGEDITGRTPARAPRRARERDRTGCVAAADRSLARGLAPTLRRGLSVGLGGTNRQACGCALHRGRSSNWLKLKCAWEQELVVGGFTDPGGSRSDFGALLVGYYEDAQLRYAGKVGTGFTLRRCTSWVPSCASSRHASHRLSTRDRSRVARIGRDRSSSPR